LKKYGHLARRVTTGDSCGVMGINSGDATPVTRMAADITELTFL
jgi:hypothetical protein